MKWGLRRFSTQTCKRLLKVRRFFCRNKIINQAQTSLPEIRVVRQKPVNMELVETNRVGFLVLDQSVPGNRRAFGRCMAEKFRKR